MSGLFFDVATVLGIGDPDSSPAPPNESEGVILRVPRGLSVKTLDQKGFLDTTVNWYARQDWYAKEVGEGDWFLRVPIPNTTSTWNWEVERFFLAQGESQLSPPLAIAALFCLRAGSYKSPFENQSVLRCPAFGRNACIHWSQGKIFLGKLDWSTKGPHIWAGSYRRIS